MAWNGIVGKSFAADAFETYVNGLQFTVVCPALPARKSGFATVSSNLTTAGERPQNQSTEYRKDGDTNGTTILG